MYGSISVSLSGVFGTYSFTSLGVAVGMVVPTQSTGKIVGVEKEVSRREPQPRLS